MLQRSSVFAVNGTHIYTPDAPLPFAFGHLQSSAGRSLSGYAVKNTVRYNVLSCNNIHYTAMTLQEFREMFALFMQTAEYFNFTFYDPTIGGINTAQVYCNNFSGYLMSIEGEGLVTDVSFSLVGR